MSSNLWFFYFLVNYVALFSYSSMSMGVVLMLVSFLKAVIICKFMCSWYSLLFFLIYMGGLLVLFIYVSSLNSNPVFSLFVSKNLLSLTVLMLMVTYLSMLTNPMKVSGSFSKWESINGLNLNKMTLFSDSENLFVLSVGILLLVVLWMMSKLSFRNSGALRC